MEKNRSAKVLSIIALLVSVVGLSLGFAAFSRTLTINSSATVNPSTNDFRVVFSTTDEVVTTTPVVGVSTPSGIVAEPASIASTSISNLKVDFTAPGQKAEYSFYAANTGEYDAYLRSIVFKRGDRECVAGENTREDLVQDACDDISLKVRVGEGINLIETSSNMSISGEHKLGKGQFEPVTVTIEYAADGARADGDFEVTFGTINLVYSSAQS